MVRRHTLFWILLGVALTLTGCGATDVAHHAVPVANRGVDPGTGGQGGGSGANQQAAPMPTRRGQPTATPPGVAMSHPAATPTPTATPTAATSTPATPVATPTNPVWHTLGTTDVALTFDDGPSPYTPQILALLRQYHVRATFCVIGVNVQEYPDMIKAILRDGHALCNHSWSHDLSLGRRSVDAMRADLLRTDAAIRQAAGDLPVTIRYFRAPGGNFTATLVEVVSQLEMTSIMWDVDPRDWETGRYGTGQAMANHIVGAVTSTVQPGSIVLSHDGGGDRSGTMIAYQSLLPWLQARYTLIKLPTGRSRFQSRNAPR